MSRLCTITLSACIAFAASPRLGAQIIDVAIGAGSGSNHSGLAADASVLLKRNRVFAGLTGALDGYADNRGDKCRIVPPSTTCVRELTFRSLSAIAGVRYELGYFSAGVGAGPGIYSSSDDVTAAGAQVRAELATLSTFPLGLVLMGRRAWLPNYQARWYEINAVTFGLRLTLD